MCDVVLIVEGKEFCAHRAVLAAASSYFQNLFTIDTKEKREENVEIGELKCAVMEDFLEFIYTGDVLLTESNSIELLKTANYTNACHLERLCEEFLNETLSLENCLSVGRLAEMFDCQELKKGCCDFIKKHFSKVLELPGFLEMTGKEVELYLSSDDIVVKEEEEVYEGLVKWVKHKPETRKSQFAQLFSFVRVGCLSKQFLFSTVRKEEMVCGDLNCLQFALKALTALSEQCSPSQRPRACLSQFTEVILLCGGFENLSTTCLVTSSNTWCKLPDCCSYQEFSVAVELEGFCYVLGGKHSSRNQGRVSDVLRYESRTNTWSTDTVEPMPKAVSGATAVSFKGRIYVMGGGDRFKTLNTVQKYNPDTNSWELVKPLKVSREGACSVSDGVNIYILGGMIGMLVPGTENDRNRGYEFECLNECEKYDSRNDSWSVISPMNEKRCYAAAAVLGHQIFVIGGGTNINGIKEARASCEVFNIPLDAWTEIAPLSVPRYHASAALFNNTIYVIGGENEYLLDTVECYCKQTNEWQIVSQMPKGRSGAATCTLMLPKAFIDSCPKLM